MRRPEVPVRHWQIAEHWADSTELPDAPFRFIGLGEPSCFRCGWLPPVPDEGPLPQRWRQAGRYLDRAHLVDWSATQDDSLGNIVLLCHFPCHDEMPPFREGQRDEALAWVAAGRELPPAWTMVTTEAHPDDRHALKSLYLRWLEKLTLTNLNILGVAA